MLNKMSRSFAPSRVRGFSLIEMMVATAVGMIVVAGAVTLIVAISHANSETIQSTRINQEMRTLASVIGEEIRRARRLHDPITYVGQGGTSNGMLDFIDTSKTNTTAGDCLIYGYQDTTLDKGLKVEEYENYYEAIYLTTSSGVGSVKFALLKKTPADMAGVTDFTSPLGCTDATNTASGATPIALTSTQLNVTGLSFSCVTTTGATVSDTSTSSLALRETCSEIDVTLKAKLTSGDVYESSVVHTYVQQVFIRSGAAKTS